MSDPAPSASGGVEAAPFEGTSPANLRDGILHCLKVFTAVRVGLFVLGLISVELFTPLKPVSVTGWPAHPLPDPGWHNLFTSFERFDALWFLRIAADGYRSTDGSAAFFPLYPMAIRAVSWLIGGHTFAASLIVSNASFFGALCVLYFLTASEMSEGAARRTVVYVALFPTSFFFFAPYSESLFLLLAVTALWAARRDRWVIAALMGALAALTRNVGIVLAPALAVEAIHQRLERRSPLLPRLAASAFIGLGTFSYLAYWSVRTGDWLAPVNLQVNWERVKLAPWKTLTEGTKIAFRWVGNANGGYWMIDWMVVILALVAAVALSFRFRPGYLVFAWGGLLAPLSFVFLGRPLMSMPRFVLVLFPLFWVLAWAVERGRIPHAAVLAVEAAGLGLLTVLFVNWYYIF